MSFISPYSAWILKVHNSAREGNPLPLPEGVELSKEAYAAWQQSARNAIDRTQPIPEPKEWADPPQVSNISDEHRSRLWNAVTEDRLKGVRSEDLTN